MTTMHIPPTIAEHVRGRRLILGLSYGDLELRLRHRGMQLSRQSLSLWERGKRNYTFEENELTLLADALQCSLQDLGITFESSTSVDA